MRLSAERLLPIGAAIIAATATAAALSAAAPARGKDLFLTVRAPVAAGRPVPPGDFVAVPLRRLPPPARGGRLYATVPLEPGEPVVPGDVSRARPPAFAALGSGIVAENLTLPASAVPAGAVAGEPVAVAGSATSTQATELLADRARIVAFHTLPAAVGEPATDIVTLALPLPSALAVAAASRLGTVALLPWRVPAREVRP
jgi:hypothetical protein